MLRVPANPHAHMYAPHPYTYPLINFPLFIPPVYYIWKLQVHTVEGYLLLPPTTIGFAINTYQFEVKKEAQCSLMCNAQLFIVARRRKARAACCVKTNLVAIAIIFMQHEKLSLAHKTTQMCNTTGEEV